MTDLEYQRSRQFGNEMLFFGSALGLSVGALLGFFLGDYVARKDDGSEDEEQQEPIRIRIQTKHTSTSKKRNRSKKNNRKQK
jgi:hypothetical protein